MSHSDPNRPRDGNTEIAYGWDVVGSDGDKIGSVAAIQPHYISVEKGFLFKEDIFIPTSAISSVADETVHVDVTKDQIEDQDWAREPEMTTHHRDAGQYNEQRAAGTDTDTSDRMHIQLSEEQLNVNTHEVERGSVHVHKDVVTEEQSVNVPLREEEVRVERHEARSGQVPDDAFQEQDIEIPIRGEEADVTKSVRVREEVDITKDVHQRDEQVHDTVRREEVHVDRDDNLHREREERS